MRKKEGACKHLYGSFQNLYVDVFLQNENGHTDTA